MNTPKPQICDRCKQALDGDGRTLHMACGYDMSELQGVPFAGGGAGEPYTLHVCKECRADWLLAIQKWFLMEPCTSQQPSPGTGIFIRHFGGILELTEKQWVQYATQKFGDPNREPYRVKP